MTILQNSKYDNLSIFLNKYLGLPFHEFVKKYPYFEAEIIEEIVSICKKFILNNGFIEIQDSSFKKGRELISVKYEFLSSKRTLFISINNYFKERLDRNESVPINQFGSINRVEISYYSENTVHIPNLLHLIEIHLEKVYTTLEVAFIHSAVDFTRSAYSNLYSTFAVFSCR